jgi:hypothetical protein
VPCVKFDGTHKCSATFCVDHLYRIVHKTDSKFGKCGEKLICSLWWNRALIDCADFYKTRNLLINVNGLVFYRLLSKPDENLENSSRYSLKPFSRATVTEQIFTKLLFAHQIFMVNSITKFHENPTNLFSPCQFVCLFSWRYKPLWLYFPQPGSGL